MKKILLILMSVTISGALFAQKQGPSSISAKPNNFTNDKQNQESSVTDPTINGIPYSQYKAQVQAQQAAKAAAEAKQIAAAKQEQQNMLGSASSVGSAKQNTQAVIAEPQPSSIKNTSVDNEVKPPLKTNTKN